MDLKYGFDLATNENGDSRIKLLLSFVGYILWDQGIRNYKNKIKGKPGKV